MNRKHEPWYARGRSFVQREPLDRKVILTPTRAHFVGSPTKPWWEPSGSHHTICGTASGDPVDDTGDRPTCLTCERRA